MCSHAGDDRGGPFCIWPRGRLPKTHDMNLRICKGSPSARVRHRVVSERLDLEELHYFVSSIVSKLVHLGIFFSPLRMILRFSPLPLVVLEVFCKHISNEMWITVLFWFLYRTVSYMFFYIRV